MCEGRPVVNSVKARLGQTARSTMAVGRRPRLEVGGEVGPLGGAVGQRRLAAHLPWWVEAVGVVLDPLEPAIVAGVSPAHGRGEGSQSLRGLPRGHLFEGDGGAQVVPEPVTGRDDGGSALLAVDGVEALLLALADVFGAGPPLDFVEQFADLVLGRAPGTVSERAPHLGHAAGVLVAELDMQPPGRGVQPAGLRPRGARLRVGSARRRLAERETESPFLADDPHYGAPDTPLLAWFGDHCYRHPAPFSGPQDQVDQRDRPTDLRAGHRHGNDPIPLGMEHAPLIRAAGPQRHPGDLHDRGPHRVPRR